MARDYHVPSSAPSGSYPSVTGDTSAPCPPRPLPYYPYSSYPPPPPPPPLPPSATVPSSGVVSGKAPSCEHAHPPPPLMYPPPMAPSPGGPHQAMSPYSTQHGEPLANQHGTTTPSPVRSANGMYSNNGNNNNNSVTKKSDSAAASSTPAKPADKSGKSAEPVTTPVPSMNCPPPQHPVPPPPMPWRGMPPPQIHPPPPPPHPHMYAAHHPPPPLPPPSHGPPPHGPPPPHPHYAKGAQWNHPAHGPPGAGAPAGDPHGYHTHHHPPWSGTYAGHPPPPPPPPPPLPQHHQHQHPPPHPPYWNASAPPNTVNTSNNSSPETKTKEAIAAAMMTSSSGPGNNEEQFHRDADGRPGATSPSQIANHHRDEVQHMGCTCKKTRCLKLYCQCFGVKLYCGLNCRCLQCYNTKKHEKQRKDAMRNILSRNPSAFDTKFKKTTAQQAAAAAAASSTTGPSNVHTADGVLGAESSSVAATDGSTNAAVVAPFGAAINRVLAHKLGCKCRKSACMKKYCECYAGNVKCSSSCRCVGCKNMPSSFDRESPDKSREQFHILPRPAPPPTLPKEVRSPPPAQRPRSGTAITTSKMVTTPPFQATEDAGSTGEPWVAAAHSLTFMKRGSPSSETKKRKSCALDFGDSSSMPSLTSLTSSETTSPGGEYSKKSTDDDDATKALLMAAVAMTEFGQSPAVKPDPEEEERKMALTEDTYKRIKTASFAASSLSSSSASSMVLSTPPRQPTATVSER